jgi:hypothetical protein
MARKPASSSSQKPAAKTPAKTTRTEVRNTAIPRGTTAPASRQPATGIAPPAQKKQLSREQIAKRAYEIWRSGKGGSEMENWLRAERELRA